MRNQTSKQESGTQLLTRLGSRPDISKVDPYIFGSGSSPSLSSSSTSHPLGISPKEASSASTIGRLVEIFGPEGVGKTELALHYLAKICLPQFWKNKPIGGVGAKAVIVDTDFKFSVLRLAVIMEKQILSLHRLSSSKKGVECLLPNAQSNVSVVTKNETIINSDLKTDTMMRESSDKCDRVIETNFKTNTDSEVIHSLKDGWESLQEQKAEGEYNHTDSNSGILSEKVTNCSEKTEEKGRDDMNESNPLTLQEIEDIVHESLGRVHVVKPNSCQQLFMTLLSLEMALASDLQTSVLLIDSISAFFWEDRLAENSASSAARTKTSSAAGGMSHVAGVVSRLVSKLGVTVIMTKAPLVSGFSSNFSSSLNSTISRKRKRDETSVDTMSASTVGEESVVEDDHVEFLGRAWANLNARRVVLSEDTPNLESYESSGDNDITSLDGGINAKRVITASCSCWTSKRQFTFVDDALQFL